MFLKDTTAMSYTKYYEALEEAEKSRFVRNRYENNISDRRYNGRR